MSVEKTLYARSGSACELCGATAGLSVYEVPAAPQDDAGGCILVCSTCLEQINDPDTMDANHWRCLNESMWNETPAVKVMVWRLLDLLRGQGWPQDLLDMLYLDDDTLAWAQRGTSAAAEGELRHIDSNGNVLEAGDTVILTQDLNVKGASFTAKRGTAVRRISLVADNPEQIEGRVNDQQIVILTKYVKKAK